MSARGCKNSHEGSILEKQREGRNGSFDKDSNSLIEYLHSNVHKGFMAEREHDMNVSEISHGTIQDKKDKFISDEAKEYIQELVDKNKDNMYG